MLPNKYQWRLQQSSGDIIEHIVKSRNLELYPSVEHLYDPFLLKGMDKATSRILKAKDSGESIVIYGDYDVDGITSTAILYMFLTSIGCNVSYYIPNRMTEGYGLNGNAIRSLSPATLMITVDTGIAAVNEVDIANECGMDVIITDHHECQENLPLAYCIINHKQADCNYPTKVLAGVGITFKLICALASQLGVCDSVWQYLDIVAIGTVADMVGLVDENRILVSLGFKAMENSKNLGLRALLSIVNPKNNKITAGLIGYQIGPRINAVGRLADAKLGVKLLTATDENEAREIANQLDEENTNRKNTEDDIVKCANLYIDANIDLTHDKIVIAAGEGWHHGVVGIVASRILARYYKPTVILGLENGVYSGSCRSIEGFNVFSALCEHKDLFVKFGGHEMAAGLTITEDNLEAFISGMKATANELISDEMLIPKLDIDLAVNICDLNMDIYNQLMLLQPFGMGNEMPIFQVEGIVAEFKPIGKNLEHLKLVIKQDNRILQMVGFGMGYYANHLSKGETVIVAGELSKNEWNNNVSLQLIIKAIRSPDINKFFMDLYKEYLPCEKEIINQYADKMIPSYNDCKIIYTFFKNYSSKEMAINRAIHCIDNMSEYKLLKILDIFVELGFISYKLTDEIIYYDILEAPKTKLENSIIFMNLQQLIV
ncbi:MAG: single-stranded-DNA-specific exonuclease RecJ [Epulopiscium sp. Nuni2H_MBin001]|nr:MAG: single-stranded-DNA-specific exonuclease RecJ [Epulopiscium sp. Nuni2H_MBin001]